MLWLAAVTFLTAAFAYATWWLKRQVDSNGERDTPDELRAMAERAREAEKEARAATARAGKLEKAAKEWRSRAEETADREWDAFEMPPWLAGVLDGLGADAEALERGDEGAWASALEKALMAAERLWPAQVARLKQGELPDLGQGGGGLGGGRAL